MLAVSDLDESDRDFVDRTSSFSAARSRFTFALSTKPTARHRVPSMPHWYLEALKKAVLGGAGVAAERQQAMAVAVYVELISQGANPDDALDDAAGVLDLVENSLHTAGFSTPLQLGSSAILGVKLLRQRRRLPRGASPRDC